MRPNLSERWTVCDHQIPGALAHLPQHFAHRDHLADSGRRGCQGIEGSCQWSHTSHPGDSQLDLQVFIQRRRSVHGKCMQTGADLPCVVVEALPSQMQGQTEVIGHRHGQDSFAEMDGAQCQRRRNCRAADSTLPGDNDQPAFEHRFGH